MEDLLLNNTKTLHVYYTFITLVSINEAIFNKTKLFKLTTVLEYLSSTNSYATKNVQNKNKNNHKLCHFYSLGKKCRC